MRLWAHAFWLIVALTAVGILAFAIMTELEPRLTSLFRGLCGCALGMALVQFQLILHHTLRIWRPVHHDDPIKDTIEMHRRRAGQHLRWFLGSLALTVMFIAVVPQAYGILGAVIGFCLSHAYLADFHNEEAAKRPRRQ